MAITRNFIMVISLPQQSLANNRFRFILVQKQENIIVYFYLKLWYNNNNRRYENHK